MALPVIVYIDLQPYDFDPADHTVVEKREMEYWEIVADDVMDSFGVVSSDQVYGVKDCKHLGIMRIYHYLQMFLSFIHEERVMHANASSTGVDEGNAYYIDKYCIPQIRKDLVCRGVNKSKINEIFNLYELISTNVSSTGTPIASDGIGFMGIEAATGNIFRIS